MAGLVGAELHDLLLQKSVLFESLPRIIRHQNEPLADPVCMPVYFVSKLARDCGVIVCQVGEGSDELFCGYPYWNYSLRLQRFSNLLPIPNVLRSLGLAGLSFMERGPTASYRRQW